MGYALNAITSVSGFAPGVRAEPSAAVGSMEDFVVAKRRLRASWGAIAAMTGVSEHVLRRSFDRTYQPPPGLDRQLPAKAPEPEAPVPSAVRAVTTGDVVRLLTKGAATHEAICVATRGAARDVSDILGNGRRRGIFSIAHGRGGRPDEWSLTATGRMHRAAANGGRVRVSKRDLLAVLLAGPMTVAEATAATKGSAGTVATYLATLKANGLVSGASDGASGRISYGLTDAGRQAAEAQA